MHRGEDPVLEKHYVPRPFRRTRSVLTFFAEDALMYANADVSKAGHASAAPINLSSRTSQITLPGVMPGWCAERPGAATSLLPTLPSGSR
jgi:hypothetical protein